MLALVTAFPTGSTRAKQDFDTGVVAGRLASRLSHRAGPIYFAGGYQPDLHWPRYYTLRPISRHTPGAIAAAAAAHGGASVLLSCLGAARWLRSACPPRGAPYRLRSTVQLHDLTAG